MADFSLEYIEPWTGFMSGRVVENESMYSSCVQCASEGSGVTPVSKMESGIVSTSGFSKLYLRYLLGCHPWDLS